MEQFGISEIAARLLLTYLAQTTLGVVMFFIFDHFSKVYIRRFLRTWSRSWLSFSVYSICTFTLTLVAPLDIGISLDVPINLLAQLGAFFQIIFILMGSYQFVFSKPITRKTSNIIFILTFLFAFVTVISFSNDPNSDAGRYVLRFGSRSIVSGCGFLFAAGVVWTNPKFTKGYGQNIMALSFLIFSVYQFFYLSIVISNVHGTSASIPGSTGLINLLMISMMSMGMVMWLLEDERAKLDKANKDLDSFIYSTSHDLRAPIASILGLTYIGKSELQEEKARNFMDLIDQRVKKLNAILTDILSLARTKKLEVKMEILTFSEVVSQTLSDIQFDESTSPIKIIYSTSLENRLYSDLSQMKIILGNLISNAIKYHRLRQESPSIKINFNRTGDKVTIEVEDNGQGIPEKSLPRIFEMFFRATEQGEGTGLGLFIVKEALEKIKGSIDVKSIYGQGTTFSIYLENV
jgi:signal transduction histidine kinase